MAVFNNILAGSSGQAAGGGGYAIERSLRFNSADSSFLSRTPASAGNRKTWTWAGWVKRSQISATQVLMGAYVDSSNFTWVAFVSDDTFSIYNYNGGTNSYVTTTGVLRDTSAWYHLVAVYDSNNAVEADRYRLYINGNRAAVSGLSAFPTLGLASYFNHTTAHNIGRHPVPNNYFNGYLADVHFIDGQALDSTSFGEFDANGIWQPIEYSDVLPGPVTLVPSLAEGALIIKADDATITGFVSAAGFVKVHSSSDGINWTYREQILSGALSFSAKYIAIGGGSTNSRTFNPSTGGSYTWAEYSAGTQFDTTSNITLNVTGLSYTPNSTVTAPYGTNGFHLDFADNSSAAALGYDAAGSNDWTVNNLSVTAGSGNDSLVDVPTNGTETDTGVGGEVRGNYCTWNPLFVTAGTNPSNITFSNGNLDYSKTTTSYGGQGSTIGIPTSGKWFFEITSNTAINGSTNELYFGLAADALGGLNSFIYNGIEFEGSSGYARAYVNGSNTANVPNTAPPRAAVAANDVFGFAIDRDAGTAQIYKNGSTYGAQLTGLNWPGVVFPYLYIYGTLSGTANFGQRPFAYPVSGFKALCTTNLPAPTIEDPSTVMDVALYTGNGSTNTISGLNLSPDLVWIKTRSAAVSHALQDIVRGTNKVLYSNSTGTEDTYTDALTSFNSDGFTLGAQSLVNNNTSTYVAWTWDAGSSTVTNNDGSITSSVRANPSAGFSIVSYTGAGGVSTIGHGLGVAPGMFIVKDRDNAYSWHVYHQSISNTLTLLLESTAAATNYGAWNATSATSSVFTVNGTGVNALNQKHIAYCFAPVESYSAFGSYTGNGSADGPFVFCDFRPRWVLIKETTNSNPWFIYDTARDTYNQVVNTLWANTSDSESSIGQFPSQNALDCLSNGFKIRGSLSGTNRSSGTFVWAAFAENPFALNARAR